MYNLIPTLLSATGAGENTAAPVASAVTPATRYTEGGQLVTIQGTDLKNPTSVTIDGVSVTIVSSGRYFVQVLTEAHAAGGPYDVEVTTALGSDTVVGALSFVAVTLSGTTSLTPIYGPASGGTVVTVTGTNFIPEDLAITIGGVAALSPTYVNATTVTFIVPVLSNSTAALDVVVTMYGAGNTSTLAEWFTKRAVPTVASVDVTTRPLTGAGTITITGTNFASGAYGGNTGTLGGTPVTLTYVNGTTLTFTAPSHTAGAKDLIVTNIGGTSNTLTGAVTYYAIPTVTSVSTTAKTYAQAVTITVSDSTSMTAGTLGGTALTSFTVVNATTITATLPGKSAGSHDLVLTGHPGGNSTAFPVTSVNTVPVLTAPSPTSGSALGGTALTITGSGFANGNATSVTLANVACTSFTVVDDTTITCTTPAATVGSRSLVVVGPAGSSSAYAFDVVSGTFDPTVDWTSATCWLYGGAGVTESGGAVSAWADQSGNGNNFIQNTAGFRPAYDATDAGFNNLPTMSGDGADDFMIAATMAENFISATGHTWIAVVRVDAVTAAPSVGYDEEGWFGDGSGGFTQGTISQVGGTPRLGTYIWDGGAKNQRQTTTLSAAHVITSRHNGTTLYTSVDGAAETSVACGSWAGTGTTLRLFSGASLYATVTIAEVAFSDVDEGTTALADAVTKLKAKYGIA